MKIKYKTRKTLSQILSVVLVCVLGLGAICGVSALSTKLKEETKEIHLTYHIGDIGNDGTPIDYENAMYSDAFECGGLTITPEFDSQVMFKVAFYDSNGEFVSITEKAEKATVYDVPLFATHARVILSPKITYENEDDRIGLVEQINFANDITVKVFKDQTAYEMIEFKFDTENDNAYFSDEQTVGSPLVFDSECDDMTMSALIDVSEAEILMVKSNHPHKTYRYAVLDRAENVIEVEYMSYDGDGMVKIDLPNNAYYVRLVVSTDGTYNLWLGQ